MFQDQAIVWAIKAEYIYSCSFIYYTFFRGGGLKSFNDYPLTFVHDLYNGA